MAANYRERLNAGLYSPNEEDRAKAVKVLDKALRARLKAEAGEVEVEAEDLNEQRYQGGGPELK